MNEEELYKLLNIPNKPWIELTDEETQLFEKNNNYIKQLQQENVKLKQQLKDKDEKISKAIEIIRNDTTLNPQRQRDRLTNILESNKEE